MVGTRTIILHVCKDLQPFDNMWESGLVDDSSVDTNCIISSRRLPQIAVLLNRCILFSCLSAGFWAAGRRESSIARTRLCPWQTKRYSTVQSASEPTDVGDTVGLCLLRASLFSLIRATDTSTKSAHRSSLGLIIACIATSKFHSCSPLRYSDALLLLSKLAS